MGLQQYLWSPNPHEGFGERVSAGGWQEFMEYLQICGMGNPEGAGVHIPR
jgi:hypothetical protein